MYLGDAPGGKLRMGELADRLLLSRSGITRLVDRLARQGLIERERCKDDGRGYYALLTDAGSASCSRAPAPTTSPASAGISSIGSSPAQIDALVGRLEPPPRPTGHRETWTKRPEFGRYAALMTLEQTAQGRPTIDRARVAELTEREMQKLAERTPQSKQRFERGVKVMPNGVPSSFQVNKPWPVYLERGEGARVWDVDGGEYVDFHNGFGVMAVGHANPTIGEAVKATDRPRHPLRRSHRRLDRRRRGARRPLRPAAVAVHELRHRVDDGRGPPRARGHRPRHDPEDRGLLPRPPRLGHGQRLSPARGARRPRRPALGSLRRRLSAGAHRAHPRRPLQRRRRRSRASSASSTARSPG